MSDLPFGLREDPFAAGHERRFVHASPDRGEILDCLTRRMRAGESFIVLTGEAGTGKSSIIHEAFGGRKFRGTVAILNNPSLTRSELLEEICIRFGLTLPEAPSKPQLMALLERHLVAIRGQSPVPGGVLVVDEAHLLEIDLLEELRLLANLQAKGRNLLQVVLVGLPLLEETLALPRMEPLRQRIAARCRLQPFDAERTHAYLQHRLAVVGASGELFPEAASHAIHDAGHGVAREINTLAAEALAQAHAAKAAAVAPEHVSAAVEARRTRAVLSGTYNPLTGQPPALPRVTRPIEPAAPAPMVRPAPAPAVRAEAPAPAVRTEAPAPAARAEDPRAVRNEPAPPARPVPAAAAAPSPEAKVAPPPAKPTEPSVAGSQGPETGAHPPEPAGQARRADSEIRAEATPAPAREPASGHDNHPSGRRKKRHEKHRDRRPSNVEDPPEHTIKDPDVKDWVSRFKGDRPIVIGSRSGPMLRPLNELEESLTEAELETRFPEGGEPSPPPRPRPRMVTTPRSGRGRRRPWWNEPAGLSLAAGLVLFSSVSILLLSRSRTSTPIDRSATATALNGAQGEADSAAPTEAPARRSSATRESRRSAPRSSAKRDLDRDLARVRSTARSRTPAKANEESTRSSDPVFAPSFPAAEPEAAAPEPPPKRYALEVATYINETRAREEMERLSVLTALPTRLRVATDYSGTTYRILVGRFDRRSQAERAAEDLVGRGILNEARITSIGPAPQP